MLTKKTKKSVSNPPSGEVTSSSHLLNPTLSSRLEEKFQLQNLNDRLATYIDRVRFLEAENNRLTFQVQSSQETVKQEATNIKSMYDRELADVRKVLDDTAREKARLQIESVKWKTDLDEVKAKLSKKDKECESMEQKVMKVEVQNENFQNQLHIISSEKKHLEKALKETEEEKNSFHEQLNQIKAKLEEETISRVDLLNRLQSVKEDLSFKESLHEQVLSESRIQKQISISDIDLSSKEQYEQKLVDTLRQIREQYELQIQQNKDKIGTFYEKKIQVLQQENSIHLDETAKNQELVRCFKAKAESLTSKLKEMEAKYESTKGRVKDLEKLLEQERDWHERALQTKDEELKSLKDMMDCQLKEYQDLLEIKTALDVEIAAYRKLLESEESRLNINPKNISEHETRITSSRRVPLRAKRKLTDVQHDEPSFQSSTTSIGDIEISDEDVKGKYIKLFNKGSKDIAVEGWKIIHKADEQETVYKFHKNSSIKANSYCIVWSSDANATHNPPTDLVLKRQKWFTAKSMVTVLLNSNGEEIAVRKMSIKKVHKDLECDIVPSSSEATEELYHHQGDPVVLPDHCLIM